MSKSPAPASRPSPAAGASGPVNRHAATAVERQRSQLDKLLKDPAKPAYVPPPPKEKSIRPPREMMKNVQGSSAGAGSGEFHVYKASRRREYERLKLLDEMAQKEIETAEFERKRKEAEEHAEAKTAKNRAKRQKKKERSKGKSDVSADVGGNSRNTTGGSMPEDAPLKKRRLVNGTELVFRMPGEDSDGENAEGRDHDQERPTDTPLDTSLGVTEQPQVVEASRIVIHEDD